jgi:hypothetical protein
VVLDCYYAWQAMDAARGESHTNALDAANAKSPYSRVTPLPGLQEKSLQRRVVAC